MGITTSQQIARYFNLYQGTEMTFTKEIIAASGLVPRQCFLKCLGEQWGCVIYSSSFQGAKIIANVKGSFYEKLKKANNLVSLRFCFKIPDKADPRTFFVAAKITGFSPYPANPELNFLTLAFPQRPPDDLIEIMGRLVEASINSAKRRDERIELTVDAMRKLGIASKETAIFIQGVPRRCILRDISFSGVKAIIVGLAKFLIDKEAVVRVTLEDPNESVDVKGKVIRFELVEGRKDLAALAIAFDEHSVPMRLKMRINDYLSQFRKLAPAEKEEAK